MRLVDYHTDEGHRVAIVDDETGERYMRVVFFDPAILTVNRVAPTEARHMRDIQSRPRIKHTPLQSTARRWLRDVPGKTDGARELLARAGA